MHSQNKEAEAIQNYFGEKVGTFLDIGANDGQTFSNSRDLALRGWKGVLIEPSPCAFVRLKELYKGHKGYYPYEVAISNHNGKAILQESGPLIGDSDIGLVSTFHPHEQDRFRSTVKYLPIEVKTYTWKTFYNRLTIKEFNFISIDCEGEDLDILKQIDLSKTQLVCVEWNGKEDLKTAFSELMPEFKIIYTSGENLIFGR